MKLIHAGKECRIESAPVGPCCGSDPEFLKTGEIDKEGKVARLGRAICSDGIREDWAAQFDSPAKYQRVQCKGNGSQLIVSPGDCLKRPLVLCSMQVGQLDVDQSGRVLENAAQHDHPPGSCRYVVQDKALEVLHLENGRRELGARTGA